MAANPILQQPEVKAELLEGESGQILPIPADFRFEQKTVRLSHVTAGMLVESATAQPKKTKDEIRAEVRAMFARIDSHAADPLFPNGRDQGAFEVRTSID